MRTLGKIAQTILASLRGTSALLIALVLLVAALCVPRLELPRTTYDYVVVFDLSQSMSVLDHELDGRPVSRLTYAKQVVRSTLPELPCGSRVGWGAFAEYRTVVLLAPVEVCSGYDDLLNSLDKIDGRMRWGNASEITKGVFWSMRAARDLGAGTNIIFLTDGQEAPPLDATRAAVAIFDDLTVGTIEGWLVGLGGDIPMPIPKTDSDSRPIGYWRAGEVIQRVNDPASPAPTVSEHLSLLHESHLQALAREVGFRYARLSDAGTIEKVFKDPRFARRAPVPTDVAWIPSALALVVLVVRFRPAGLRRLWQRSPRSQR